MKPEQIAGDSESSQQKALFCQAARHYEVFPELKWGMFAVPNGGKRDLKEAAKMKAEGVTAGVSDIMLLVAKGGFHGYCIEMKAPGKLKGESQEQKDFGAAARERGYKYDVFDNWIDAWSAIVDYLTME